MSHKLFAHLLHSHT